ncbi:MAG: 2Fe-2S iron-sulfur cluster-binding protein, partial [Anaerolineales bacterium]
MKIELIINGRLKSVEISPGEKLLFTLRALGYHGVKFGDEGGLSGADTVLLDGKPINAGLIFTAQAEGHKIATIESLGEYPQQGWKRSDGLHPLQKAFIETGAIQCGYCTPAQILAAKHLLDQNPNPSESQVRDALSGVLCRCTGYLKPVQAVLMAAAQMRGEAVESIQDLQPLIPMRPDILSGTQAQMDVEFGTDRQIDTKVIPGIRVTPKNQSLQHVGKPQPKVDAIKLAQGKPAFTSDHEIRNMLYAKILKSPHAHATIEAIDTTRALALPGVAAVLTYKDIPRVAYSTAGQSDPIPGPLDCFSLDKKVRFVGDRVAFVAAETPEIAEKALALIDVTYHVLPALLDPRTAMEPSAPILHDESDYVNFADSNPLKNLAAEIRIDIGDVERGFKEADQIFEAEYQVPKVQQAHIEPHVVLTYWDEDDRLVIRTSTQVPFHVRRILAPV